jgi:hypothetical protein
MNSLFFNKVYFCLGVAQGGLLTLGRHNKFNYDHHKYILKFIVLSIVNEKYLHVIF